MNKDNEGHDKDLVFNKEKDNEQNKYEKGEGFTLIEGLIVVAIVCILMALFLPVACEQNRPSTSSNAEKTEELMEELTKQIGLPNIKNFREKKLAKMVYELRDRQDLTTHTYIKGDLKGKLVYLGQSVGYGLPYSVQYSNPKRKADLHEGPGHEGGKMPQPEPNGLYPPEGLSATWIMLSTDSGDVKPIYVESQIVVSQTKLPARLVQEWSLPDNY